MSTINTITTLGAAEDQLSFDFGDLDQLTLNSTMNSTITSGTGITMASNTLGGGYITSGTSGVAGSSVPYTLTSGTGGVNMPWITANIGNTIWDHATPKTLHVRGNADFEGEITIKGVPLSERLDRIEERLNILRVNEDLESKWEKLRTLGRMYRELEAEIIDKQKVWDALKA